MSERTRWALLAYRLSREPSTPRSTLWRKLRRIGAVQIGDGLAALPDDARTREQLEWLAQFVVEAGGEASTWTARLTSAQQDREIIDRMRAAIELEYYALVDEALAAWALAPVARHRVLGRLRRELRRIRARDYFPTTARDEAARAVDELAARAEEAVR